MLRVIQLISDKIGLKPILSLSDSLMVLATEVVLVLTAITVVIVTVVIIVKTLI